ncbi:hypothetical protein AB0G67_17710 [Streptomyces sp. NPDC021056]|uniref:hypothetical protein n=1 Tax=Streptomyces sp. NPDC021056 TaxID=3155012 RepID=UPI0033D7F132
MEGAGDDVEVPGTAAVAQPTRVRDDFVVEEVEGADADPGRRKTGEILAAGRGRVRGDVRAGVGGVAGVADLVCHGGGGLDGEVDALVESAAGLVRPDRLLIDARMEQGSLIEVGGVGQPSSMVSPCWERNTAHQLLGTCTAGRRLDAVGQARILHGRRGPGAVDVIA